MDDIQTVDANSISALSRRSFMIAAGGAALAGTFAGQYSSAQQSSSVSKQKSHPPSLDSPQWLCEDGFKNTTHDGKPGFQVRFRMVPYRAEPLSCVEGFEVSVDGEKFDQKDMILTLNYHSYRVTELPTKWTRWQDVPWWFTLDCAEIFIPRATPLSRGAHKVAGGISIRMPFATLGRGQGARMQSATKRLVLESL